MIKHICQAETLSDHVLPGPGRDHSVQAAADGSQPTKLAAVPLLVTGPPPSDQPYFEANSMFVTFGAAGESHAGQVTWHAKTTQVSTYDCTIQAGLHSTDRTVHLLEMLHHTGHQHCTSRNTMSPSALGDIECTNTINVLQVRPSLQHTKRCSPTHVARMHMPAYANQAPL